MERDKDAESRFATSSTPHCFALYEYLILFNKPFKSCNYLKNKKPIHN